MSSEKPENKKRGIKEVLIMATCPKCGKRYVASDGHSCPEKQ
jgi:hypothetical protein